MANLGVFQPPPTTMTPPQQTWPSPEFLEDLVYAARANALDEIQAYVQDSEDTTWTREQRVDFLSSALDEGRNTALHVAAANGHLGALRHLIHRSGVRLKWTIC